MQGNGRSPFQDDQTSVATNIVTADHSFSDAELDAFMASIPVTEFATV